MAYGLKYTYSFFSLIDYSSPDFKLNIYLEGYGGASSEIKHLERNSIVLNRGGDLLENIQGTKLTFTIYNLVEAQYKEFRTADWGDYKVELIQDPNTANVTRFIGYNQSEIYSEPFTLDGKAKLEFTCGLSHLKHVRWDASGTLHTGQKTIIEVIRLALNLLPTPVDIREFVNIYEDSITSLTTSSMFNQIYVDSSVYKETSQEGGDTVESAFFCNKVLDEILKPFNAHLYHWNGIWYILNPQEYTQATMYWRQYIPRKGTESTVTVDSTGSFTTNTRTVTGKQNPRTATELILPSESAELNIEPPLNRVSVNYNMKNLDMDNNNLIKNGCWGVISVPDANFPTQQVPDFWTFTGSDFTTYVAMAGLGYQFSPVPQSTASTFNSGVHGEYSKTGMVTDTGDSVQFSFEATFIGRYVLNTGGALSNSPQNFVKNDLEFIWEVEIQLGAWYLVGDAVAGYSWQNSTGRATFKKVGLQASGSYVANIQETFTFTETLPTLPQSAVVNFRFRFYRAYSNWSTYAATNTDFTMTFTSLYQKCFSLIYLPSELPPVQELILYSKIIEDENLEELEVIHGDGPHSPTLNSFRLSTGVITNQWTRRGKGDAAEILTILLRQIRDLRGQYLRNTSAKLIGEFNPHNTIIDSTDVSTEYWQRGYDWAVETGEYTMDLQELLTSVNSVTINTSIKNNSLPIDHNPVDSDVPQVPNEQARIIQPNPPIKASQTNLTNYN